MEEIEKLPSIDTGDSTEQIQQIQQVEQDDDSPFNILELQEDIKLSKKVIKQALDEKKKKIGIDNIIKYYESKS